MKKTTQKALMLLMAATLFTANSYAQDDDEFEFESEPTVSLSAGFDIVSDNLWRGIKLNDGFTIRPDVLFEAGGFFAEFTGASNFDSDYKEFNISLGYGIGPVSFYITDYWSNENCHAQKNSYTEWRAHYTPHILEASIDFAADFGLDASMNLMFYGNDKKEDEDGYIKNNYSTYLEIGYTGTIGEVDIRPFIGSVFNSTEMYGDFSGEHEGFNVVNLGFTSTYTIKVGEKIKVPVFASFVYNPQADDAYVTGGIRLGF